MHRWTVQRRPENASHTTVERRQITQRFVVYTIKDRSSNSRLLSFVQSCISHVYKTHHHVSDTGFCYVQENEVSSVIEESCDAGSASDEVSNGCCNTL